MYSSKNQISHRFSSNWFGFSNLVTQIVLIIWHLELHGHEFSGHYQSSLCVVRKELRPSLFSANNDRLWDSASLTLNVGGAFPSVLGRQLPLETSNFPWWDSFTRFGRGDFKALIFREIMWQWMWKNKLLNLFVFFLLYTLLHIYIRKHENSNLIVCLRGDGEDRL